MSLVPRRGSEPLELWRMRINWDGSIDPSQYRFDEASKHRPADAERYEKAKRFLREIESGEVDSQLLSEIARLGRFEVCRRRWRDEEYLQSLSVCRLGGKERRLLLHRLWAKGGRALLEEFTRNIYSAFTGPYRSLLDGEHESLASYVRSQLLEVV